MRRVPITIIALCLRLHLYTKIAQEIVSLLFQGSRWIVIVFEEECIIKNSSLGNMQMSEMPPRAVIAINFMCFQRRNLHSRPWEKEDWRFEKNSGNFSLSAASFAFSLPPLRGGLMDDHAGKKQTTFKRKRLSDLENLPMFFSKGQKSL